jgi:hypothetical protein
MTNDQIEKLYELMNRTTSLGRDNIRALYLGSAGDKNISFSVKYYLNSKDASVRKDMVTFVIRYARTSKTALELGIRALRDRSKHVHAGCAVLAYSLRNDMIPYLKDLLNSKDEETRNNSKSAIKAIQKQDINLFVKPTHDEWIVSQDRLDAPTKEDIDFYIKRNLPDLVEPIKAIFGTIYPK